MQRETTTGASRRLTIEAGSRLHFGLWAWGPRYDRQFGGVGMMIKAPALRVSFSPAEKFEVGAAQRKRISAAAEACQRYFGWNDLPACRIEVETSPPPHVGLGVGTQTDLTVTRGLTLWQGHDEASLAELTLAVDRGGRSSVGAFGFEQGGLIVDGGRGPGDTLGELQQRVAMPEKWRVLLLLPKGKQGLSGAAEREAFECLPPVPPELHKELVRLASDELVPAAEEGDFEKFAEALYHYGRQAGHCYSAIQSTPYSSPEAAELVERLRAAGVAGVTQSSWGPTLLALRPGEEEADETVELVRSWDESRSVELVVSRPLNQGARVER